MIIFKQKEYRLASLGKKAVEETVTHPVALASLGLGAMSYKTARENRKENERIRKESAINSEKQIRVTKELIDSLANVKGSLDHANIQTVKVDTPNKKKKRVFGIFSEKTYTSAAMGNLIQKTLNGAAAGAGLGTIGTSLSLLKSTASDDQNHPRPRNDGGYFESLQIIGTTTLIGAALGALVGIIQNLDARHSQSVTNTGNIMDKIQYRLKQLGYVGNKDYTKDPKFANLLKTKVCIVVSRSSDDLKLLINYANDPQLKEITNEIVKGLPKTAVTTEKASNRFNDLSISTLSKGTKDPDFVVRAAEMFIKRGFPVYLVEVG